MARGGGARGSPTARSKRTAPATCGTTVGPALKPTPRSSRYCITPKTASRPKALPPVRRTPFRVGTRWRGSRKSGPGTATAQPRSSTPPTAGRSVSTTVQPVRPTGSVTCPTRMPGTSVIIPRREAPPPFRHLPPGVAPAKPALERRSMRGISRCLGSAADLGGTDAPQRDLRGKGQAALGQPPREGQVARRARAVQERAGGGPGQAALALPAGGGENPRHLHEPPRPEPPRLGGERRVHDALDDGGLAFALLLVGEHEAALLGLEQLEGGALEVAGIQEPARQLGQLEQLPRVIEQRGVVDLRRLGLPWRLNIGEERPPAGKLGGGLRAEPGVERQRLGDERRGARRGNLDPGELLALAERAELALEPLLGDGATRGIQDAGLVVHDQGAERPAAECAWVSAVDGSGSRPRLKPTR